MTAQKSAEQPISRAAASKGERKPWVKKTPVEVVLDQIERVKADVAKQEEALKLARRQLQKLEEARKVLESNT